MHHPTPEIILHQFAASPFSEKLRLVLGFKALAYKSVKVPAIMPKPDVVALTGGVSAYAIFANGRRYLLRYSLDL